MHLKFTSKLEKLKKGSSYVIYNNSKYLVTKEILQNGKVTKLFAKQLDGTDFISFNLYKTKIGDNLKPCEMPEQKILDFINNYKNI